MIKTTMDAVIEFKGEIEQCATVEYCSAKGAWLLAMMPLSLGVTGIVCTHSEFNTLVDWLSTDKGRVSAIGLEAYVSATKQPAIKKESESMEIDWSKAPEGCTGYSIRRW